MKTPPYFEFQSKVQIFAGSNSLEKIGKDIFICVPMNITVDYSDTAYADLSDKLTWKEPQL